MVKSGSEIQTKDLDEEQKKKIISLSGVNQYSIPDLSGGLASWNLCFHEFYSTSFNQWYRLYI